MKGKFLVLALIIGLIFVSGCLCNSSYNLPLSKQGFLTYTNSEYGFKIDYPADWSVRENIMGAVVVFLSPRESTSDNFLENVNIIVQDNSMTLEEYTNISLAQLPQYVSDLEIISSERTTLGGNPAYKVVFTGVYNNSNRLEWMQVWTMKDNKVYLITYTAQPQSFSKYLPQVQHMFDSFEFT
jgi:hypothetical protein